jgi:hypothetical protein
MDTGTIVISVLTVVVFAGIIFAAAGGGGATPAIEGVQEFERTDRTHTNESVAYQQTPPVGGAHTPVWIDCNAAAYESPVDTEKAVHALEHGAVWISYEPNLVSSSTASQLQSYLANYTFVSPVRDQGAPIKLSAWGHQLAVDNADDPRIQEFIDAYRQGPQTPEPGASCNPPNSPMSEDEHHEHDQGVNHYHDEEKSEGHHDATSSTSTQTGTTTHHTATTTY